MPPKLALCLCLIFIAWLFRRYSKEAGPLPWSLWVPFIWVTINASRPLATWFSNGTSASQATDLSDGSFYDRNAYLLLMGIGVFILARRRVDWGLIFLNCRWLFLLYGYYLLSTLWSPDSFIAFKRWFKADGDFVMILIMLTEADPVEALRAVFVRAYYVLVPLSVVVIKYYPDIGRYIHKWTYETFYCGLTTNKNQLGQLAMLGGIFLMWHMVDMCRNRGQRMTWRTYWPDLLILGMCLWLLHLAGSSTAVVCFLVGTAIFFCARLGWVKHNLKNLSWCVVGLGLLMVVFTVSPEFRGLIAGLVGRNATLTDRTLIWDAALKSGSDPIIGEGYEGYWLSGKGSQITDEFHVQYAHNGYLDQYLDVGWIGVLLFAGMLYVAGRNAVSHFAGGSSLGYLFMALFWSCLLFNYTEIAFGRSNVFGFLISSMIVYGSFSRVEQEVDISSEGGRAEETKPRAIGRFQNVTGMSRFWK